MFLFSPHTNVTAGTLYTTGIFGSAAACAAAWSVVLDQVEIFVTNGSFYKLNFTIHSPSIPISFGQSLSVAGSVLAIGAPTYQSSTGAVFLYEANTNFLFQSLYGPSTNSYFGNNIIVTESNDRIYIGAKNLSKFFFFVHGLLSLLFLFFFLLV